MYNHVHVLMGVLGCGRGRGRGCGMCGCGLRFWGGVDRSHGLKVRLQSWSDLDLFFGREQAMAIG